MENHFRTEVPLLIFIAAERKIGKGVELAFILVPTAAGKKPIK